MHTHCHTDWRVLVGGGAVGLALWAGGLSVAYSYQMSETPLVRNLVFMLRHDAQVHELLGDRVRAGFWYSGTFNDFKVRLGVCRTKRQQQRPCVPDDSAGDDGVGRACRAWPSSSLRWRAAAVRAHRRTPDAKHRAGVEN